METNFFEQLKSLGTSGTWKLTILQNGEEDWVVSALLTNDKIGDSARKQIAPLTFKGTVQQLDSAFFTALQEPAKKTDTLFVNMEHYLKELDTAQKLSKMEQDKESKDKKEKEERKKRYAELMKKVDELEEQKLYQQAIATLPKADAYPEQAEEIKKRLEALRQKNGQLSLM